MHALTAKPPVILGPPSVESTLSAQPLSAVETYYYLHFVGSEDNSWGASTYPRDTTAPFQFDLPIEQLDLSFQDPTQNPQPAALGHPLPNRDRDLLQLDGQLWVVIRHKELTNGNVEIYTLVEQSDNGKKSPLRRSWVRLATNELGQQRIACWPVKGLPSPKRAPLILEAKALLGWLVEKYDSN